MSWWNKSTAIPTDKAFSDVVRKFVFECPSSTRKGKNSVGKDGKKKKKQVVYPVSARGVSFRSRGVTGHYLLTILAQIRRPLVANEAYHVVDNSVDIENKVKQIISGSSLSDPEFDLMVFQKRDSNQMPETEAIYYYIRNAFAHGSFEVKNTTSGRCYYLESSKEGNIKAQMRLKETTLQEYIRLSELEPAAIKQYQKPKKRK